MHINVKSYCSQDLPEECNSGIFPSLAVLGTGLVFWLGVIALVLSITLGTCLANDPYVMKIYPDGTKVVLKWSEVGKSVDDGGAHGGAPKIVAYDPSKDGVVPIGQPSQKSTATPPTTNAPSGVSAPAQPSKMSSENMTVTKDDQLGPEEGFGFRTDVGVAFQQSSSGRDSGNYYSVTYQPGIRFDIEPYYNLTDWFSLGVETGFVHNTVHSISVDGDKIYNGNEYLGNADLYQVPILLNTRFQFPTEGPIRGFVGGGIGGNWNFANTATRHEDSGTPFNDTSYQWNYAFELSAGMRYTILSGLDLNATFKTLCTPNPLREAQDGQVKASYNYAAEIGVAWRF